MVARQKAALSRLEAAQGEARLGGFEPPTFGTGIQRSIQLSYKRSLRKNSYKLDMSPTAVNYRIGVLCNPKGSGATAEKVEYGWSDYVDASPHHA